MNRKHYMDNLRACLMLSGVLMHSMLFLSPATLMYDWYIHNAVTKPIFYYLFLLIHNWYMPLFYLLGGYFSQHIFIKRGVWGFIKHRLFRIGLPLLICFLLLSLYNAGQFINYYKEQLPMTSKAVYGFFGFIGPLWFIYYLLIFYFIMLAIYYCHACLTRHPFSFPLWSSSLLLLLLGFCSMVLTGSTMVIPSFYLKINLNSFNIYFSFFMVGWIIATRTGSLELLRQGGIYILGIGLVIIFPVYAWLSEAHGLLTQNPLLDYLVMLLNISGSWLLCLGLLGVFYRFFTGYSSLLRYLANASYWFYLIQVPVVLFLQAWLYYINIPLIYKLLDVYLIALLLMTLTYAIFVKKTIIGKLLNGERR